MILRRIATAIKNQDWFVVLIEIVIVVIGVYIGIYLGDLQERQKLVFESNQSLIALENELRSDLNRLDEVVAFQKARSNALQEIMDLLGQEDIDTQALGTALRKIRGGNDTLYSNRSAYQTMTAADYLIAISDETLRLQIARLYEREFDRQAVNSNFYDGAHQAFIGTSVPENWDQFDFHFFNRTGDEPVRLRNNTMHLFSWNSFYTRLLENVVRPEMVKTLEMIDAYQGEIEE